MDGGDRHRFAATGETGLLGVCQLGEKIMKKHKILFVDDEPEVLSALKNVFHRGPYEIVTAGSGREGLAVLAGQPVDVVVSDERMPGMSGTEFLSAVRRSWPETIRIVLTGQASMDAAIRAINEGEVYRFLTKPCNPVDLSYTIRHALQLKDLMRESAKLLSMSRRRNTVLDSLELAYPGITRVDRDSAGAIVLQGEDQDDPDALVFQIAKEVEQLREKGSQLVGVERVAGIRELAVGVAHEIDNLTGFLKSTMGELKNCADKVRVALEYWVDKPVSDPLVLGCREHVAELGLERVVRSLDDSFERAGRGLDRISDIAGRLKGEELFRGR